MAKKVQTKQKKRVKKKITKAIPVGRAYIKASFNNTVVSMSDSRGNVVCWSSSGKIGYRGAKKSTAYVAQLVAEDCAKLAHEYGMHEIEVYVKGPGSGRESAIRALQAAGMTITAIKDITPVPHNGCRPRKHRRV